VTAAYVETSAVATLVLDEAPGAALRDALRPYAGRLVTSELTALELGRAARRALGEVGLVVARSTMLGFDLLALDRAVLTTATRLEPPVLRALDAIHVASALAIGPADVVFFSYDLRTIAAARANGLAVASPGAP
jgi:predicted nucleic acid-binding protein